MTKKELSQLYYLEKEIAANKRRIAELKHGGDGSSDEATNLEALIQINIQKRWYEKTRLLTYINTVDDSLMRQILTLRYVDCKNWTQVAMAVGGGNTAETVRQRCRRYLK